MPLFPIYTFDQDDLFDSECDRIDPLIASPIPMVVDRDVGDRCIAEIREVVSFQIFDQLPLKCAGGG
jgi:hypothetical protein